MLALACQSWYQKKAWRNVYSGGCSYMGRGKYTPHSDMFLQCVYSIRIHLKFNLYWWGMVLSVDINSSNWWVPMGHDSHHCLYQKKGRGLKQISEHCSYSFWTHWLPSARWHSLKTTCQLFWPATLNFTINVTGAAIIPFCRWKRGGMKETDEYLPRSLKLAVSTGHLNLRFIILFLFSQEEDYFLMASEPSPLFLYWNLLCVFINYSVSSCKQRRWLVALSIHSWHIYQGPI